MAGLSDSVCHDRRGHEGAPGRARAAGDRRSRGRSPSASRRRASGATSRRTPSTTTPRTIRRTWRRRSCASASSCSHAEVREVETQTEVVGFGSCVEVEDAKSGKQTTYTLVSAPRGRPGARAGSRSTRRWARRWSARSVGDTRKLETPRGARELKILAIGADEAPRLVGEHVGRLERREVPAVGGRLPALDVEDALDERARHVDELLREVEERRAARRSARPPPPRRRAPSRRAGAPSTARTTSRCSPSIQ